MAALDYTIVDSPVGPLLLAGTDTALHALHFADGRRPTTLDPEWTEDPRALRDVRGELDAYFAGRLQRFTVPLAPAGTPFQLKVWTALRDIPYGQTISYGELAQRIGDPNAVRAVGAANGANPIAIIVPCHRVIGADGSLVGFGGGLPVKKALLALERGERKLL
jgi:methylated-DNA-[protein]-cysteine S-methyltransferase